MVHRKELVDCKELGPVVRCMHSDWDNQLDAVQGRNLAEVVQAVSDAEKLENTLGAFQSTGPGRIHSSEDLVLAHSSIGNHNHDQDKEQAVRSGLKPGAVGIEVWLDKGSSESLLDMAEKKQWLVDWGDNWAAASYSEIAPVDTADCYTVH